MRGDHGDGTQRREDGRSVRRLAVSVSLLVGLAWSAGGARPQSVLEEYTQAAAAMKRKDYRAAAAHLSRALDGAPTHPGLMAELARAEALAGERRPALLRLEKALELGGGLDVVDDPAMGPALAGEEGARVRSAAGALRAPVSTSREAFRLAQRDLIPEGIAYDPVGKHFYVGSIYRRKIVRLDGAGRVSDFVGEGRDGLLAVLGMKVDAARRALWVATEGTLSMKGGTSGDVGRSALLQYDLRSGRLLKKVEMRPDPAPHLFNDLVVGEDGGVFLTDSEHGSVWRLRAGSDRLDRVAGPRALEYPNGIALSSDERRLFVAHLAGIAVFDLATGARTALPHSAGLTLTDIDGLYREDHRLVAVQNGLTPPRVVVFDMTAGEDRVVGVRILERGHPLFASIPTTGTIAEGWFYYIANAQLRAFSGESQIFPLDKLQEPVILKTPLEPAGGRAVPRNRECS